MADNETETEETVETVETEQETPSAKDDDAPPAWFVAWEAKQAEKKPAPAKTVPKPAKAAPAKTASAKTSPEKVETDDKAPLPKRSRVSRSWFGNRAED